MLKTILVPVDGSANANKAVVVASELAQQFNAELTLLNVMHRSGGAQVPAGLEQYSKLEHLYINEHDLLHSAAEKILMSAEQVARDNGVSNAKKVSEVGNPAHHIADYAKNNGIDMIVMGSRGLSDLSGLLLGSVSHKVSHLAACSCLLVK